MVVAIQCPVVLELWVMLLRLRICNLRVEVNFFYTQCGVVSVRASIDLFDIFCVQKSLQVHVRIT